MTEPLSEADQIAQLQQQIQELVDRNRQAEVDAAYWRGRCESLEQNLNVTPAVTVKEPAVPEVSDTPSAPSFSFSPEKLLPLLQPLLSNPDILKMVLPLLKAMSTPRPADG